MKHKKTYLNTSLEDLPNEEWRDIFGFDGMYSISNLGRVKSETRYDNRGRLIRQRILKQHVGKTGDPTVKLSINNKARTYGVSRLVGAAFLGDKEDDGFVYCHKDKNKTNNRKENLMIVSWSVSSKIDYQKGKKIDWGIKKILAEKHLEYIQKYGIYKGSELIAKKCTNCFKSFPIEQFPKRHNSEIRIRICYKCKMKQQGVKDVGKNKERKILAADGRRYCVVCKQLKNLEKDFYSAKNRYLNKSYTCKVCSKRKLSEYQKKQKDEIGDFYVKQYASRKYNKHILNNNEVEIYRKEIINKRKAKYHLDGKSFLTKRSLANYIKDVYNLPVTTTEKRLSEGKSIHECTLSENEIRSRATSKGKIKVTDTVTGKIFIFRNTKDKELNKMFSSSAITRAIKTGKTTKVTKLSKYKNKCFIERFKN